MKSKSSNLLWGFFLLFAAVFVVANQFNGFINFGIGSIITIIFSLAFLIHCIANLNFALLPFPLALLYIVFQAPMDLPELQIWVLILASVLASIGLAILFPRKYRFIHKFGHDDSPTQIHTENLGSDNNPVVSVNFGAISRRLQAESLETVKLYCNFGAMEIFFDRAEPGSNSVQADITCSFGAIKLYIPKHWQVIDRLKCTLGGIDMDSGFTGTGENAPKLILSGNVSMGGVEVQSI